MTVYNLGSINADYFYQVPHIPAPGETLAATEMTRGLGGKGANQSVALAHSGASVHHVGAVGSDGTWLLERLESLGLETDFIETLDGASGHAIITVAKDGENAITLFKGANRRISERHIVASLANISDQDWLILQNETNGQSAAIACATAAGAKVAYSAAPFDVDHVKSVIDDIDLLVVNETEAAQLVSAFEIDALKSLPTPAVLMTLGSKGAVYLDLEQGSEVFTKPIKVTPKDTTGAGDTFVGFFVGRLSVGDTIDRALDLANQAAALKVTKAGTAEAIPTLADVREFSV